jgi:hypothetical protein
MHDRDYEYNEENFNFDNENHDEFLDRIKINYDKLNEFTNFDVHELKLGNLSFLKRKRFSTNLEQKDEKIKLKMEKGEEEKQIPSINFIRWRAQKTTNNAINSNHNSSNKNIVKDEDDFLNNNKNNDLNKYEKTNEKDLEYKNIDLDDYLNLVKKEGTQNYKMQTNSKIVEWSDGTLQMVIGSNYFDINPSVMDNCRFAIYDKPNDLYVVKNPVKKRLIIMASEMTKNIEDRFKGSNENSTKTKLAYSFYDKNEFNKSDFDKKRYGKKAPNIIDKLKKNVDESKNGFKKIRKNNYK